MDIFTHINMCHISLAIRYAHRQNLRKMHTHAYNINNKLILHYNVNIITIWNRNEKKRARVSMAAEKN